MQNELNKKDPNTIILGIIYNNPGITDSELRTKLSTIINLEEKVRIEYLQSLNRNGCLRIKKDDKGEVVFYFQDSGIQKYMDKLDKNDKAVYEAIEESKNKGMSKAELRGVAAREIVNSSLKSLVRLNLVKTFKAKNKKRNIFILFNLQPDEDLVGGELYVNGQLDYNLITTITSKIEQFVAASTGPVQKYQISSFVLNTITDDQNLKESDLNKLINILLLDDRIEDVGTYGMEKYVISRNRRAFQTATIASLPCMTCPVIDECRPGNKISPENCVYFDDW